MVKYLLVFLLSLSTAHAVCTTVTLPTDYLTVAGLSRANLNASFTTIRDAYNGCKEEVNPLLNKFSLSGALFTQPKIATDTNTTVYLNAATLRALSLRADSTEVRGLKPAVLDSFTTFRAAVSYAVTIILGSDTLFLGRTHNTVIGEGSTSMKAKLPDASTVPGRSYTIKNFSEGGSISVSSVSTIRLSNSSGENVYVFPLTTGAFVYDGGTFVSDGTYWNVVTPSIIGLSP